MRFSTNELAELEAKIASAADRALAIELAAFERLRLACLAQMEAIRGVGLASAAIDVSCALAELAVSRDWTRPVVDDSLNFVIEGGRHPVVEAALRARGEPFVANDADLSGETADGGRIALITGPNMARKSTYLRQNALITSLPQMGAFVAALPPPNRHVDPLFSPARAAHDLPARRST